MIIDGVEELAFRDQIREISNEYMLQFGEEALIRTLLVLMYERDFKHDLENWIQMDLAQFMKEAKEVAYWNIMAEREE